MKIGDIMTIPVITARPDAPFEQLLTTMLTAGISAVPIVDDAGHLVGIVTEGDLVAKAAFGTSHRTLELVGQIFRRDNRWVLKAAAMTAKGLMTSPVVTVSPDDDMRVAAGHLVTLGFKRVVAVDTSHRPVGIVSRRDVLRALHESGQDDLGSVVRTIREG
jgi:CBS domain-containing protein